MAESFQSCAGQLVTQNIAIVDWISAASPADPSRHLDFRSRFTLIRFLNSLSDASLRHPKGVCIMSREWQKWGLVLLSLCLSAGTKGADDSWTGDWVFKAAPEGAVPLDGSQKAWRDPVRKIVLLDGEICLREGPLEMFACPRHTKEHESIVAVDASPRAVHAGLVSVGAEPGAPVQFDPYRMATGTSIKIMVVWLDESGKRCSVRAQDWIQNANTGKPMEGDWVFAGSRFARDEQTGQQFYLADGGDFICVSNFTSAAIDVPIKSSQESANLIFRAYTEKIPKEKTKVRLVLIPASRPAALAGEAK
jgi:hypothetical protein